MNNKAELGEFDFNAAWDSPTVGSPALIVPNNQCRMQIVFAIDASNSMQGYKIGAVNDSVNNVLTKLKSLGKKQGSTISVAVIGFASRLFRWTKGFVPVNEFKFSYVEMADGLSDWNAFIDELIDLSDHQMEADAKKYVILYSDGLSTDNCTDRLCKWSKTGLYKDITKVVVAFDEDLKDPQSMGLFREFVDGGDIILISDQEKLLSLVLTQINSSSSDSQKEETYDYEPAGPMLMGDIAIDDDLVFDW